MSIHKRAKDMGVSDLVKKLEKLEEENKKLREDLGHSLNRENEVRMFCEEKLLKVKQLEKENKRLKEDLEIATKVSSQEEGMLRDTINENKKLKEELSKESMNNWFDKKAKNIFMEEDTLQELRDLGVLKDDEGLYD